MIYFGSLDIRQPAAPPWVRVFTTSVYAYRLGHHSDPRRGSLMVSPDLAGDLAAEPIVWVFPIAGDMRGLSEWQVGAIGFTEDEASEALETFLAEPLPHGPDWREQILRLVASHPTELRYEDVR